MMLLLLIALSLWGALLLPPVIYYAWMLKKEKGRLCVQADTNYQPNVSMIVCTYNEAKVIERRLENIQELDYPENNLQIILVDSASNDGTLEKVKGFLAKTDFRFPITLISEKERLGKSHALNVALKQANGEIIATSDADSFWDTDALLKAVAYFADPSVGAVTGKEKIVNVEKNVHTMGEGFYRTFFYTLRLGESCIHSTILFQGELALYRKNAFKEFENRPGYSDDIGTVINLLSNGYRCIFVPEAVFHDTAPFSLGGRLMLKSRRSEHLISGVFLTLKLKIKRKLPLSWRVVLFNFYLHVISPLLLIATLLITGIVYIIDFRTLWFLGFLLILLLLKKPRVIAVSYLTSNLALIMGLYPVLLKKRSRPWKKVDEMRE
ncbi:MAG: glycosyltransferase [Candidatus Bathyarchaeia archaeon]|jgi:cellulose synthase/poly-beta-1,6-N-acetylglucosamine synthase-like glycosyltransferase